MKVNLTQEQKKRNESNKKLLQEIADELTGKGYLLGHGLSGKVISEPKADSIGRYDNIGIIVSGKKFLFNLIKLPSLYLTEIWIDNRSRDAEPNKKWVLDVYGSEMIPIAQKIVENIAKPYCVEVSATLKINQLRYENQALHFPGIDD